MRRCCERLNYPIVPRLRFSEAIVNDPIGALAAVLAYEVIVVSVAASTVGEAAV